VIYVKTDLISEFFGQVFPRIKRKFILITHNSDYDSSRGLDTIHLDNAKLIAWFGENPGFSHPKHFPIPIGFSNPYADDAVPYLRSLRSVDPAKLTPWSERKYLVYSAFRPNTNPSARQYLLDRFKNVSRDVLVTERIGYEPYMKFLGEAKFVLCPRGNGLDSHRFYEAVLMGAIPVIENSTLWPLYQEAEAVVIPNMAELTSLEWLRDLTFDVSETAWEKRRRVVMWETWESKINAQREG
jgi:hypothetical protein